MKKATALMIITLASIIITNAQESETIIKPITVDKSTLSGIGLKKIDLKNEPEKGFYQKRLFWGHELGVFVVGTETWTNNIKNYPFDEFVYMFNGEAIVKPANGTSQIFYSGDYFFAPKGFNGEWEIKGNNHIHYELSVITTKRSDSSKIIKNSGHKLFNKSKLSGNSIILNNDGYHEETLEKGAELTVKLIGEKPGERTLSKTTKEQLIQILSGQVTITNTSGSGYIYYTGDFFIIPKGLGGKWKNEGHNLVKYLSVEKTL